MASVFKRGSKKPKRPWYASWYDHHGKRQTQSTRTTDKATAERIASKMEADAALRRGGGIDPMLDGISKESARSIESHLVDFESKLRGPNRTEKHIKYTVKFIRWITEYAGFVTAGDISADGVNRYVGKLRDNDRASRTIQAHLNAIKAFTKWLTEHHKLPRDPLASVKTPNPKADRRRERRMLLPDEWQRLVMTTATGPVRFEMTREERLLLYRTAIQTGLRSNELRSLTRGRLYLDADTPYITCKAGTTKNRKDARQYIQPELAVDLKAHYTFKAPTAPIFNLPHETNLARMLREDLAEARNQWITEAKDKPQEYSQRQQSDFLADVNHEGEKFDFHCLRHTCGAWLAMTGAHPQVVQHVMQHSSITLTMETYGHLIPGQEADAVGRMQEIFAGPPEALRATGTDNASVNTLASAQRQAQRAGSETLRSVATGGDEGSQSAEQQTSRKPLRIADLGDGVRLDATGCKSSGGGTRTGHPFPRKNVPHHKTWVQTGNNSPTGAGEVAERGYAAGQRLSALRTSVLRCLEMHFVIVIARFSELAADVAACFRKPCFVVDHTKSVDTELSRGGTRTPDTQIMIPTIISICGYLSRGFLTV